MGGVDMVVGKEMVKEEWPVVKLGDVAFFQEGPGVRKWQFRETGIKLINVKNIVDEELNIHNSDKFLDSEEVSNKYQHFLCDAGDLVMASSGATWGKTAWVKESDLPLCMNTSMIRFKSLDESKLCIRYLRYVLKSKKFITDMERLITGSAQPNFGSSHLKQIEIPLPPLPEQKRIAAILDKADGIRRKRLHAIQLADDFLKAVFLDMFGDPVTNPKGWDVGTIRDLVETVNYGSSAKASEALGEYPILRMGNITYDGKIDLTDLKYIDLSEKEKPKFLIKNGDLLFNRTNSRELVGKTAVYEGDKPLAIAGYLIRVRCNGNANSHYISGYLNSVHGKTTLINMCKSIVGMANINAQELQDIKILKPPVDIQDKYKKICEEVRLKVVNLTQSFNVIDSMCSGLACQLLR